MTFRYLDSAGRRETTVVLTRNTIHRFLVSRLSRQPPDGCAVVPSDRGEFVRSAASRRATNGTAPVPHENRFWNASGSRLDGDAARNPRSGIGSSFEIDASSARCARHHRIVIPFCRLQSHRAIFPLYDLLLAYAVLPCARICALPKLSAVVHVACSPNKEPSNRPC